LSARVPDSEKTVTARKERLTRRAKLLARLTGAGWRGRIGSLGVKTMHPGARSLVKDILV